MADPCHAHIFRPESIPPLALVVPLLSFHTRKLQQSLASEDIPAATPTSGPISVDTITSIFIQPFLSYCAARTADNTIIITKNAHDLVQTRGFEMQHALLRPVPRTIFFKNMSVDMDGRTRSCGRNDSFILTTDAGEWSCTINLLAAS